MFKPNFSIAVVIGYAVLVVACSKTEAPASSASDTLSANAADGLPTTNASVASGDVVIQGVLPDVDMVFLKDYTTAGSGGDVLRSNAPTHVLRLHMDIVLKKADPAVLETALQNNQPQAFLTELKKEPASAIQGHRGMKTLKMALGCTDASDSADRC